VLGHHGGQILFLKKNSNSKIQKNMKKYRDVENIFYYSHAKNHVKISFIIASAKKIKL
jgi:hypothetical protein